MFDWERFFAQAERLALAAVGEEDYRTAVSRLYYVCHLIARDLMFGVDAANWGGPGRRPSHRAVMGAAERALPPGAAIRRFQRLREMREKADYISDPAHPEMLDLFAVGTARDWAGLADEALGIVRDLLPLLRRLPPAP